MKCIPVIEQMFGVKLEEVLDETDYAYTEPQITETQIRDAVAENPNLMWANTRDPRNGERAYDGEDWFIMILTDTQSDHDWVVEIDLMSKSMVIVPQE